MTVLLTVKDCGVADHMLGCVCTEPKAPATSQAPPAWGVAGLITRYVAGVAGLRNAMDRVPPTDVEIPLPRHGWVNLSEDPPSRSGRLCLGVEGSPVTRDFNYNHPGFQRPYPKRVRRTPRPRVRLSVLGLARRLRGVAR